MLQVLQSQESTVLSSPPLAATDPGDKSAKKRSSSKVSRFNIKISKAVIAQSTENLLWYAAAPAQHCQQFCWAQVTFHIIDSSVLGLALAVSSSLSPPCKDEKVWDCVASLLQQWQLLPHGVWGGCMEMSSVQSMHA